MYTHRLRTLQSVLYYCSFLPDAIAPRHGGGHYARGCADPHSSGVVVGVGMCGSALLSLPAVGCCPPCCARWHWACGSAPQCLAQPGDDSRFYDPALFGSRLKSNPSDWHKSPLSLEPGSGGEASRTDRPQRGRMLKSSCSPYYCTQPPQRREDKTGADDPRVD